MKKKERERERARRQRKLGVIEKDWIDYRTMIMPKEVSEVQTRETKKAFYAGAGCVFYAIMNFLDPGEEPTEKDLEKMDALHKEIDGWLEKEKHKAMALHSILRNPN